MISAHDARMSIRRSISHCRASWSAGLLAAACLSASAFPVAAQAGAVPGTIAVTYAAAYTCAAGGLDPAVPTGVSPGEVDGSKSAAILGGQQSALDRIRLQQAQVDAGGKPAFVPVAARPTFSSLCAAAAMGPDERQRIRPEVTRLALHDADEFLGSARVGIRRTPFNADWQRVSAQGLSRGSVSRMLGARHANRAETLAIVNRWANRRIEYAEDMSNYGARDYWATARETLRSGRGDCEDFAILKYQVLASLGFDRSQMFLTLARDLVRNADHAVLVVRLGDRHFMLDNATDTLLPADVNHDYRPTMSFNSESAWLHGYTTAPGRVQDLPQITYLSDSAVSNARVTGLRR